MVKDFTGSIHREKKGITGLETAIILIAFVVVAAVFAYTVLSAGLFSSQKSSEAVYSGLEEAQSTVELVGPVLAFKNTAGDVGYVKFTVATALEGEAINFTEPTDAGPDGEADSGSNNVVTIAYIDQYQRYDDLAWSITKLGNSDSDNLLEVDETFEITVPGKVAASDLSAVLAHDLLTSTDFTIEIKPPYGAVLPIERRTPATLDTVMNLN